MTDEPAQDKVKLGWRFPRTFWIANGAELFERAAFYSMFITLDLYLSRRVGFSDVEAHWVMSPFAGVIYLLPTFMGAMADRIGFRKALILAFSLLAGGYTLLGAYQNKGTAILSLALIICGGAIVKPVISGTVAKCSDAAHRARAFSIFYQVVNIGAFGGKTVAGSIRVPLGLDFINFYAALMAWAALVFVVFFYRDVDAQGTGRSAREAWHGLLKVIRHWRFMCLILIVAGFWAIQGQLYGTMPKFILRLLGEGAKPEWLANINPLVVVLFVVPITHLVRRFRPENAIGVGMFIIPLTALCIAMGPILQHRGVGSIGVFGLVSMHPVTLMVVLGIGLQGLAECFLSPKFLEYASKQAPKGEVGLYLGYQHLTTFFAWVFGFALSGYLLDWYCPDPKTLSPDVYARYQAALESGSALPEAYAHAHYIWYVFTGIGVLAFVGLLVFKYVTAVIDRRRAVAQDPRTD